MKSNAVYIDTSKVNCGGIYKLKLDICTRNRSIIKGVVYNQCGKLAVDSAVEFREINACTNESVVLGYCITNERGEYVFVVEPKIDMLYEVLVYSPLQ